MQSWRLTEREKRKYAAAEQLGLMETLRQTGWAGLSAKEAGRIGGKLHGRKSDAKE